MDRAGGNDPSSTHLTSTPITSSKGCNGLSSGSPPEVRVRAIEVGESDETTWVVLRIQTTTRNPSNSPANIRQASFLAKLSWSEFKRYPDAKEILGHLGTSSKELNGCLKELEGEPEIEPEDRSNESTGTWNHFGSAIFSCF